MKCIGKEESDYIYVLKAVAIFCVVSAHTYPVPENTNTFNALVSDILDYLGTMGVPVFYVISGFLFAGNKRNFKDFWKIKLISVIVPWFFCYSMLYLYVTVRKGGFTIWGLLQIIWGYNSSSYYLAVLITFYLVFWHIRNEVALLSVGGLSILSIVSTGWEISFNFLNDICGTYYLNPLNWAIFFSIGVFIRKKEICIDALSERLFPLFTALSIVYFVVMEQISEPIWYFSKYAIIGHMINLGLLFTMANILKNFRNEILKEVGKISFTIYLTNQFLAGFIIVITNYISLGLVTILRPVIIVFLIWIMVKFLKLITRNQENSIYQLLGLGRNR